MPTLFFCLGILLFLLRFAFSSNHISHNEPGFLFDKGVEAVIFNRIGSAVEAVIDPHSAVLCPLHRNGVDGG